MPTMILCDSKGVADAYNQTVGVLCEPGMTAREFVARVGEWGLAAFVWRCRAIDADAYARAYKGAIAAGIDRHDDDGLREYVARILASRILARWHATGEQTDIGVAVVRGLRPVALQGASRAVVA